MEQLAKSKMIRCSMYVIPLLIIVYFIWQLHPLFLIIYEFFKSVLAPFIVSIIIAYVLNPVVSMLAGRRVPRSIAVLLIYAFFLTCLAVILMNIVPILIRQLQELNEHMPELVSGVQHLTDKMDNQFLPPTLRTGMNGWFDQVEQRITQSIAGFIDNIGATLNMIFNIFIVPFLIFYMLKDFEVFERTVVAYLPRSKRKSIVSVFKEIDTALGNYVRGQFIVGVIVGLFAYTGYRMVGMPYALVLSSIVAIFNIVPYLGPFLGAAPAVIMASTLSIKMVLLVALVNFLCQLLESNVVSPQVVGRTLHMHPLSIIFALLVGGKLAGIVGLIVAVPVFAVLKVILQHVFAYYIKRKT